MKLHLYIAAMALGFSLQLAAGDTNTTCSVATCCEATNKSDVEVAGAKSGLTNAAPEEQPWSLSTTGNDEKFKDLSSSLSKNSGNGPSMWRSAGATVFVLALLLGVNYWLRRRGNPFAAAGKSARMQIVERVAVDHRRSILLIEVDGERIVVSACPDRIEQLAVLPSKIFNLEGQP